MHACTACSLRGRALVTAGAHAEPLQMVEVPHRLAMHVGMQVKLLLEQAKVMPVLPHGHAPSLIEVNWLLLNDLQMCGGAAERRAAQKGYTPESGQAFAAPGQCK